MPEKYVAATYNDHVVRIDPSTFRATQHLEHGKVML
jgi:hypothetical protein